MKGLYSLLSTAIYETSESSAIHLFVNEKNVVSALSNITYRPEQESTESLPSHTHGDSGSILLQTTLQLNEKDKVNIRLDGVFSNLDCSEVTYFECKLVSAVDE